MQLGKLTLSKIVYRKGCSAAGEILATLKEFAMVLKKNLWLLLILFLLLSTDAVKAQLPHFNRLAQQSTQTEQPNSVSAIAQQVVGLLAAQRYEEVRSSLQPELREAISAEDIQQQWQQLLNRRGAFSRIVSVRPVRVFDGSLVLVTVAFEKGTDDLIVMFNDQQQIVGFDILQLNDNIQASAEEFVDALAAGNYALARRNFHSTLKSTIFPADLEREWQAAQAANGQFQKRLSSEVRPGIETEVVHVSVQFENGIGDVLVVFKQGRIAGFDFPQAPSEQSTTP